MQFRLSTLFLVFFTVATSLALFGVWGLWVSMLLFSAALCLNRANTLRSGINYAIFVVLIELLITGMLMPAQIYDHKPGKRAQCINNLKQIGLALLHYHEANGHFPIANAVDQNGTPLFSWRVEMLPMLGYDKLYNSFEKDEPWNSPHNAKLLGQVLIEQYNCPSDIRGKDDFTTNYIAIIGPGTAWREDGPVKVSDLPDGGSHTVTLVEVANSGVHWAEPRDISVAEALKRMKDGKGLGISSGHPSAINILFADGSVRCLRKDMPISVWKKLFAGEIKDIDLINEENYESATDIADFSFTPREVIYAPILEPKIWPYILSFVVWIFSVVLLFRRAVKSRRKPTIAT
jgi:prepilin-type processing-associated H-X9-DG protein